ncbi:M56 family metallopeptidase [Nocardia nova]|uniref:M56 family metallopeptidase n=1 Tax=Nocardia nova TaxID=37330 RepID=UPI0037931432
MAVWLVVLTGVLAGWFVAAVALTAQAFHVWSQPGRSALGDCFTALQSVAVGGHGRLAQVVALAAATGLTAFVALLGARTARALARARATSRDHAESALIIGRRIEGVDGVVIDAPQKAAYCVAGPTSTVVITSAALATLDKDHLDAVLAHERAHLAGKHHLVLTTTRSLANSLSRIRLFTVAEIQIARLLEMCADDKAARRHGRDAVLGALLSLSSDAAVPANAMGASSVGVAARVARLTLPDSPSDRTRNRTGLILFAASVITAPLFAQILTGYGIINCMPFML